jgi:hypothetical protein
MTETAEATATAITISGRGRGRRSVRCSLVAGWGLTRRHQFGLVVNVDGKERTLSRSHCGNRGEEEERKGGEEYKLPCCGEQSISVPALHISDCAAHVC